MNMNMKDPEGLMSHEVKQTDRNHFSERPSPDPNNIKKMDDLNDSLLLVRLIPHLPLSSLLSLSEVSARWNSLCDGLLPRQTLIESAEGTLIIRRTPVSRRSLESPSLDALFLRHSVRLPPDAQSELTVDLSHVQQLVPMQIKISEVAARMQGRHAQPIRIMYLLCMRSESVRSLLLGLPASVQASLHTLCIRCISLSIIIQSPSPLFPFGHEVIFQRLTTVKLHRTGVNCDALAAAMPNLISLQLSMCCPVHAWSRLRAFTQLRSLCIVFCPDTPEYIPPALTAIGMLTWLSAIRLSGAGSQEVCIALSPLANLERLCLRVEVFTSSQFFQQALTNLALRLPRMRHLELQLTKGLPLGGITLPVSWTQLQTLDVSHRTPIPYLSSMTHLVLRRSSAYVSYVDLPPLPRHLKGLRAPYNALRSAVGCEELRELSWTPPFGVVTPSQHAALLVAVSQEGVWPDLDKVLILPDRVGFPLQMYEHYSGQLLDTLATRPSGCVITHVTVHQNDNTMDALCKIKSLHSITLIEMYVPPRTSLLTLLIQSLPHLRLLEMIGVLGPDHDDRTRLLEVAALHDVVLLVSEMGELDSGVASRFDWD